MQTKIYKTKEFRKFANKNRIPDELLVKISDEVERGLYEAHPGAYIYKKRMPTRGRGKRGGYRTLLMMRHGKRSIFAQGLAKKNTTAKLSDFSDATVANTRDNAQILMKAPDALINDLVQAKELHEVKR